MIEPDLLTWVPGLTLLALGESLRIWAVAVIGKESRTRGSGVARLVGHGPYAYVRNPLYLGNFFLALGATFLSELLWFVPVAIVLFAIQYGCIVLWEERILTGQFGAQYTAYCQRVPRWIPRWRRQVLGTPAPPYQWRAALWSERSTLATLVFLILVMTAKENFRHLPKYLHKRTERIHAPLPKAP